MIKTYRKRTFDNVHAIELTKENLPEILKWVGDKGKLRQEDPNDIDEIGRGEHLDLKTDRGYECLFLEDKGTIYYLDGYFHYIDTILFNHFYEEVKP